MILLIQICKETFHYLEFVKPIEYTLNKIRVEFVSVNYKDISEEILSQADKVIICGTSLKDNSFLNDVRYFSWIKDFKKPIFGICGGMHLLGLVFNGKLKKQQEIGLTTIKFDKEFFGMEDTKEVYELHNFYTESNEFEILATSKYCPQAIKHKRNPFYAVLFHPEVRNKKIIENFIRNVQCKA